MFEHQIINELKDEIRRHKEQIKYSKKRIKEIEDVLKAPVAPN